MHYEEMSRQQALLNSIAKNRKLIIGSLLLCCALFLLFSATSASAAGPTYVNSDITSSATWSETNSPYVVTNNITIADGATLTIGPNVTVMVNYNTMITVNGSLVVNGQAGKMVNMTSNNTLDAWGIIASEKSTLNLNYLYLNNATGIVANNNVFVNNSRFVNLAEDGIFWSLDNRSASLTVLNSYFWNAGYGVGYRAIYASIYAHSEFAWNLSYSAPIIIKDNVFNGGQSTYTVFAVYNIISEQTSKVSVDSDFTFDGNTVKDNPSWDAVLVYRYVTALEQSSSSLTGDVLYKGNSLTNTFVGLELMNWMGTLYSVNGTSAITGDIKVLDNQFTDVDYCVWIYDGIILHDAGVGNITDNLSIIGNVVDSNFVAFHHYQNIYAIDNGTGSIYGNTVVEQNTIDSAAKVFDYVSAMGLVGNYNTTGSIIGDVSFTDNTISKATGNIVSIVIGQSLYTTYDIRGWGDAVFDIAANVENNVVDDCGGYLVSYYTYGWSHEHSTITATVPLTVANNEITHGTHFASISADTWADDNSNITYNGPISIVDNVATELSSDGIVISDIYTWSGSNGVLTDNINIDISGNTMLVRSGENVYVERYFEADDDSISFVNAALSIMDNNFQSQEGASDGAVYIEDYFGTDGVMMDAKLTVIGNVDISNNQIKVQDGSGIYYYMEPYPEVNDYGANAVVDLSAVNWYIQQNTIVMNSDYEIAIGWESEYYYIYDYDYVDAGNVTMISGDVIIDQNDIEITGDHNEGIFVNIDVESSAVNGGSMIVTTGDFLANNNSIAITGDDNIGIDMYLDYLLAYADEGNATLIVGEISANGNIISVVGDFNEALELDPDDSCVYAEAYGSHDYGVTAYMECIGGLNAVGNIITVDGNGSYGIYLDYTYNYAYSQDYLANATMIIDINVLENVISVKNDGKAWSYGFYCPNFDIEATYDVSYALAQTNLLVKDNAIVQTGGYTDAIYCYEFLAFVVDHSNYIGDAWVVTSAIFQENTVEGGVYGVYFEYSDYPIQLISNSVADTTHSAMTLVNVTAGSLVENYLIKNHGRGIEIIDGGNLSLTDNVVQDNHGDGLYISSALNVVIINGYYVDNTYVGIRTVNGTTVNWNVDGESSLAGNDAYFTGHIYVLDGGVLTIDLCDLKIYDGTDGTTLIQVDQGGQLIATNVVFDCEGFPGLFNVYGKLSMLSCTVEYWYELYLAPTSEASISGSMFIAQDRYGVYIDNCSPRIANCLFSGNELAGVFINGKAAAPSIELNVFLLNARGIYAENANLGDVVSNIFAVNYEAGIYGDSVTGRISANTFVLNKVEIYLTDSTVTISDNEIGWSHMIDVAATYSPVAAVIVNYVAEMTNIHLNLTGLVTSTAMPTASGFTTYASYVAALLVNHDGIMAYNSTLTCANNMYGLVSWAVHVEDSVLIFSDTVQSNNLVLKWLNSDLKSTNITVPVTAFNGIYARDSKVTIDNAVIQVLDTAVFLSSSTAKITDSKLLADQYDVYAVGNSSVTASGTVFDGKVKAVGDAQVSAEFQLDILTTDSNGNIVTGVTVTVKNNQGVIVATGKSDDTGHFKCSVVAYKIVNGNVDDSMNPYTVTVSFNNGDVTSSVTMTDATALTVAANADHTALYAGIVVVAIVFLVIAVALLRRRKI